MEGAAYRSVASSSRLMSFYFFSCCCCVLLVRLVCLLLLPLLRLPYRFSCAHTHTHTYTSNVAALLQHCSGDFCARHCARLTDEWSRSPTLLLSRSLAALSLFVALMTVCRSVVQSLRSVSRSFGRSFCRSTRYDVASFALVYFVALLCVFVYS